MDTKLLDRLTRTEEDLVSAMLTGGGALASYNFAWTSLLDEISQASALGDISNTTLAVADDVVTRVSTLAECCLNLSSVPSPSPLVIDLNTSSLSPFHTTTSFIPEAYSWLLENIVNPYPSSEFKASLAQRYNSPVSAVSSWFANARRRVGWTALCRDFFCNCRADAVDAAYCVLVKGDPNHELGSEVTHAFVAMKVTAEGLYATSRKSALAGDLDTAVKDMPTEDGILAEDGKRSETGKIVCSKEREEYTRKQRHPPFDPSYSSSPVPCLDENEGGEDMSPPLLTGCKRRLLPSGPAQVASPRAISRPVKRPRFSSSCDARLPSPSMSTEESFSNRPSDQMSRAPGIRNSANINSRKRRLSNEDTTRLPEHPGDLMAGPCLHAISDPLSLSALESEHSIDEWFKTNFDALFSLPPLVDVTEPDHSTQWEVELFNNYSIPKDLPKLLTLPIQASQISSSTDLTALEDLLLSLENSGSAAPPDMTNPPTMASVLDPVSQDLSLLPDFSQSIDWTALFNEEPFGSTIEPMFPQFCFNSTLPKIDLSILQLPQAWTMVTP